MDTLLKLLTSDVSKIAIFLLFFALVALIFEIFYFRKRREHETTSELPQKSFRGGRKRLVIIGIVLILLLLPATVYLVFQQVNLEQQAQVAQPQEAQIIYNCDKIDILRNNILVDAQSVVVSDMITFVGHCYAEGGSLSTANVNRLRFTLHNPSGKTLTATYLAFADPAKTTQNRRYFKASFPNVTLTEEGVYTLDIAAYNRNTALVTRPFTATFNAAVSEEIILTPTPSGSAQVQANKPPSCNSLSAIPLIGPAPLTVSFTGSASDSDGQVTVFEFTFGDGAKQTVNKNAGSSGSASISHAYQIPGLYKASLIVRDNGGVQSATAALCSLQLSVTSAAASATVSANLKAQPTKAAAATPTPVTLPQAGLSLPMVGFVSIGLLLLTFGLLLAF